jgi:diguanylate cyclase (GGDEF)-like protein
LLVIDLDDLKAINDAHGRSQGDAALMATASRVRRALRSSDFLARLAGDEFAVVTANPTSVAEAVKLGERLTVWLGIALPDDKWALPLRASIGVAVFPDHGDDAAHLMQAADWAMYSAKSLSQDESIRVAAAVPVAMRAPVLQSGSSNVIAMSSHGRRAPDGKLSK